MRRHKLEAAPEEPESKGECRHYWIIESPKGPTSRGVCKFCGAEKEFLNYYADFFWEDDISSLKEAFSAEEGVPDDDYGDD